MSTSDRIEYLEAQVIELEQSSVILRERLHREETRSERQWETVSNLWDRLNAFEEYYRVELNIAPPPKRTPPYQARHRASPGRYPDIHPESTALRTIAKRRKKSAAPSNPFNLVVPFAEPVQTPASRKRPALDIPITTTITTVPAATTDNDPVPDDASIGTDTVTTVPSVNVIVDPRPFVGKKVRVTSGRSEHQGAVFLVRRVTATKCVCNTYPRCSDTNDTYFYPQTLEILDHDSEIDLNLLSA